MNKMGPKIMSNMVHKPLTPSKWVHILWSSILRCVEIFKEG